MAEISLRERIIRKAWEIPVGQVPKYKGKFIDNNHYYNVVANLASRSKPLRIYMHVPPEVTLDYKHMEGMRVATAKKYIHDQIAKYQQLSLLLIGENSEP